MSTHSITITSGSSVRLLTAGKYCDRDVVVTATMPEWGENILLTGIDTDGSLYNGTGILADYRLNNLGELVTASGYCVTGFLNFAQDTEEILLALKAGGGSLTANVVEFYDENFNFLFRITNVVSNDNCDHVKRFATGGFAYIRFSFNCAANIVSDYMILKKRKKVE